MYTHIRPYLIDFLWFGIKEARACVFAGSFFLLLFLSHHIAPVVGIPRYDFLFVAAVLIQLILVVTKIETIDEVKMIFLFHIIGFVLEVFKTHPAIGSWSYPEFGYLKLAGVPLYSGFMYAAVGSYISQAWRLLDVRLVDFPSYKKTIPLASAIYLNFFTHHLIWDLRWFLKGLVITIFYKTKVYFTPHKKEYNMPLVISFVLMAFFIWVAENISTFWGAWQYPEQIHAWSIVSLSKISSWSLLVIISFIIVSDLKQYKSTNT